MDVKSDGNAPAESKFKAMLQMVELPPSTATDLLALIGFFGFYQEWIPYYEVRVRPWREYKKNAPPMNSDKETQREYMSLVWKPKDQTLL